MPRSKAAIATLKGFLRGELKGPVDSLDVIFAKGVKAALEWLTDSERGCPYPELQDDMGDDGGWETGVTEQTRVPSGITTVTHPIVVPPDGSIIGVIDDPYAALGRPKLNIESVSGLLDASGQPINVPSIDTSHIGNNSKVAVPGSYEAAAREHKWLREVGDDLASLHKGTPTTDRNTVVVGCGLGDEPLSAEYGGYDE